MALDEVEIKWKSRAVINMGILVWLMDELYPEPVPGDWLAVLEIVEDRTWH